MTDRTTEPSSRDRVAISCGRCSRTDLYPQEAFWVSLRYNWHKHQFEVQTRLNAKVCQECYDELVPQPYTPEWGEDWRGYTTELPIACTDNGCGHWWGTVYFEPQRTTTV